MANNTTGDINYTERDFNFGRNEARLAMEIGKLHSSWILEAYSPDGTRATWLATHHNQAFADGYRAEVVAQGELLRMVSPTSVKPVTFRDAYIKSHGARPSGRGSWAFSPNENPTSEEIFWAPAHLTVAEAKKAARAHYAKLGITGSVWLLP